MRKIYEGNANHVTLWLVFTEHVYEYKYSMMKSNGDGMVVSKK